MIAQETEKAVAHSKNQTSDNQTPAIVTYDKDSDRYGIRYTELISPIIKAIQELYAKITGHDKKIDSQARQIASKADATEVYQLRIENAQLRADVENQKQEHAEIKARLDKIEKILQLK